MLFQEFFFIINIYEKQNNKGDFSPLEILDLKLIGMINETFGSVDEDKEISAIYNPHNISPEEKTKLSQGKKRGNINSLPKGTNI